MPQAKKECISYTNGLNCRTFWFKAIKIFCSRTYFINNRLLLYRKMRALFQFFALSDCILFCVSLLRFTYFRVIFFIWKKICANEDRLVLFLFSFFLALSLSVCFEKRIFDSSEGYVFVAKNATSGFISDFGMFASRFHAWKSGHFDSKC